MGSQNGDDHRLELARLVCTLAGHLDLTGIEQLFIKSIVKKHTIFFY